MQEVCVLEAGGLICDPVFVDQQRKRDAGLFPENAGVVSIAQSDRREAGAGGLELALVFAQLRDMLAAEDSSIVAEECHHRGTLLPQRAEADVRSEERRV